MNISEHLPSHFSDTSRVWVYQADRTLFVSEALALEPLLENFVRNWQSHGIPVKGYANLFYGKFIVLMADETATGVSGCSTDSSVRLIKELETIFKVNFLDRTLLAFYLKDKIEQIPLAQLDYAVNNGFVKPDSLFFDNTISNKKELMQRWPAPAASTWLARKFPAVAK